MGTKAIIAAILAIVVVVILLIYYFMPFNELEFSSESLNYNFTIDGNISQVQFYPNMRFENKEISYKLFNCNIKKQDDMEYAFDIVENLTILDFYSVTDDEDITITCDERAKIEEGMFIAGEGGPTQIARVGNYNVILHGNILLFKSSDCGTPNVALHELFHVLGFVHSDNPNNVMYNYTKCAQTIGDDIPKLINDVYLVPNHADLAFENVSANMKSRYLNLNMSIRNIGLKDSEPAIILINMNGDTIKEVDLEELEIGNGKIITINNIFVSKLGLGNLELIIDYPEEELDKTNNNIVLEIQE